MIRFDANLFRIAMQAAATEEARYYLCGVFIEPHHGGGITMTTTDGHKLLSIRDETGFADESAIIRFGVKLCKASLNMVRQVQVETGSSEAVFSEAMKGYTDDATNFQKVTTACGVRVDGSFPDYRRVIPRKFGDAHAPAFAAIHLLAMTQIGTDLAAHFHDFNAKRSISSIGRKDVMVIRADASDTETTFGPALVTWPVIPQAFGVLMPVRWDEPVSPPAWFNYSQPPVADAAA